MAENRFIYPEKNQLQITISRLTERLLQTILWIYITPYSACIDFSRLNLKFVDVKSIPAL